MAKRFHILQKTGKTNPLYSASTIYFQDTLANNIRFYTPEATDEAIQQAIQLVGLDELVKDLPEGIHTLIGESGRMLSGGQAQRVALARAFVDQNATSCCLMSRQRIWILKQKLK